MAHFATIVKFVSGKVIGQPAKPKYHIIIDVNQGLMLFINSNPYEGAMEIDKNGWPKMPMNESFVSCNKALRYTYAELKDVKKTPCGALSRDCIVNLRSHVENSLVMEQSDIDAILAAIDCSRRVVMRNSRGEITK